MITAKYCFPNIYRKNNNCFRTENITKTKYFSIPSILILIIFSSACTQAPSTTTSTSLITGKDVSFTTEDDIKISATFWDRGTEKKIILLHMLGHERSDWNSFAEKLPYTVMAIDLRGHGESDGDWRSFSDVDFNNMILDVKAANEFIEGEPIIVGASIGANVALNYASKNDVAGVVLLSPSHDYRGVDTRAAITRHKEPLLIVTSRNDEQSYNPSIVMYNTAPSEKKQLKTYEDAGHGTRMLVKEDLDDIIMKFIEGI